MFNLVKKKKKQFTTEVENARGDFRGVAERDRVGEPCGKCLHTQAHCFRAKRGGAKSEGASFPVACDLQHT